MDTDWRIWLKVIIPAIFLLIYAVSRTPSSIPDPTQEDVERIVRADTTRRFPSNKVSQPDCRKTKKVQAECYFYALDDKGDILDELRIKLIYKDKQWKLRE